MSARRKRHAGRRAPARPTWRGQWRAHAIATGALLTLWLVLWGAATVPLIVSGLVLAVAVLRAFPLPAIDSHIGLHPWRATLALARFVADVVRASLEIAAMAVRRRPPASDIVTVQLATRSDLVQHLTALAVSLVPGSLIIDADPAARTLSIHVLFTSPRPPDAFIASVLAQERRIRAAVGDDQ
jgi:multicomponent Na+:H+ antiporter subunit E